MDRLDVVKDLTTQRVYFYPQEGAPDATPSVELLDQYGTTITAAGTGSVTVDPVSTTIATTAAAAGDKTITLTATTNLVVGVTYLLTSTLSQQEQVRVKSINTSTKIVGLYEPLEFAYALTSTLVGTRFYRTLSAGEVDTLRELCRARATYAVDSLNYQTDVAYDVVLLPLPNLLTRKYLKKVRPDITRQEHAGPRGNDFADLLDEAWSLVRAGIRDCADGWRPAMIRSPEDLTAWALNEFLLLAHNSGVNVLTGEWEAFEAQEHLEGKAAKSKSRALSSIDWIDLDEDDSISADEMKPLALTFIR
jgi:hypothetical protein